MWIRTLKRHPHGGKHYAIGDVYNCPDKKARLLITIGKAEEAPAPANARMGYSTSETKVTQTTELNANPSALNITPAAQKLLESNGVDPKTIMGTGVGGKITKQDAEAVVNGGE